MSKNIKNGNLSFFKRFSLSFRLTKLINNYYKKNNLSGIAIGLAKEENIIYENYFGISNYDPKKIIYEKTLLPWNSISQLLTTIIILKLSEKNIINLDSDIRKYLKDFKINDNKIIFKENSYSNHDTFNNTNTDKIQEKNLFEEKRKNNPTKNQIIPNKINLDTDYLKIKDILSHRMGIDYRENLFNENVKLKFPIFDKNKNFNIKNPDHFSDNIPIVYSNAYIKNKPGTETYFSNSNYLILGKLICELTKKEFMENAYEILRNVNYTVSNSIENPLLFRSLQANYGNEINHFNETSNSKKNNLYFPYHKADYFYENEFIKELSDYSSSSLLPSYGIISTLKDILDFTIKLNGDFLLNDTQKKFAWNYTGSDVIYGDFGYGFMLFNKNEKNDFNSNHKMFSVGHNGGTEINQKQTIRFYPNLKLSLVLMSNDESANLSPLIKELEKIFESI